MLYYKPVLLSTGSDQHKSHNGPVRGISYYLSIRFISIQSLISGEIPPCKAKNIPLIIQLSGSRSNDSIKRS